MTDLNTQCSFLTNEMDNFFCSLSVNVKCTVFRPIFFPPDPRVDEIYPLNMLRHPSQNADQH